MKTTIIGWIARDDSRRSKGRLFLYAERPNRGEVGQYEGRWWSYSNMFPLPIDSFKYLTWEDEPRKVTITIEEA